MAGFVFIMSIFLEGSFFLVVLLSRGGELRLAFFSFVLFCRSIQFMHGDGNKDLVQVRQVEYMGCFRLSAFLGLTYTLCTTSF
jgi:hypothetical protein